MQNGCRHDTLAAAVMVGLSRQKLVLVRMVTER
jgi:hypothetical protein